MNEYINIFISKIDILNKHLSQEKVTYNWSWLFLSFSMIMVILSLIFNNDNGTWFARSGAVLVLFAIIVEYQLSQIKNYETSQNVFLSGKAPLIEKEICIQHRILKLIAHFFIVSGTLIWAYGDCLTTTTNSCY